MLTVERLHQLLHYDHLSGHFTWVAPLSVRVKPGDRAGSTSARGYLRVKVEGRVYRLHRLAWFYCYGCWPEGVIDHIDGDVTNNRIENLRDVTQQQNTRNLARARNNTSGVTGVSWLSASKRWYASIMINRRTVPLGYFSNFEDAVAARRAKEAGLGYLHR